MKIKFDLDDKLPLNKMIEIPSMTIVIRAIFYENKKYYPKNFIHLNLSFKFQPNVWNRWYGLLMMCVNFSDITILNI